MTNFITKNKKPLMVVGVLALGYFGYKYVAKKIKGNSDRVKKLNADIDAINHAPAVVKTEDMGGQNGGGIWSSINWGLL